MSSSQVLAAADLLLPPNLKPVGLHHPSPELPKLPYSGVHPLPAFHPFPPPSAPIYVEDVKEVLGGVAGPWNLGHKVGATWGKVKVGRGRSFLINTTVLLGPHQEPDGEDEGKCKDIDRLTKESGSIVNFFYT